MLQPGSAIHNRADQQNRDRENAIPNTEPEINQSLPVQEQEHEENDVSAYKGQADDREPEGFYKEHQQTKVGTTPQDFRSDEEPSPALREQDVAHWPAKNFEYIAYRLDSQQFEGLMKIL